MSDHQLQDLAAVGEVRRRMGITARTIQHYEAKGLIHPVRSRSNIRHFDRAQQERLAQIIQLRKAGLSLREIRRCLAARVAQGEDAARNCAIESLITQRDLLVETLAANRAALEKFRSPLPVEQPSCIDLGASASHPVHVEAAP